MKTYNYTYYGRAITKAQFEKEVPANWEKDYDKIKGYSWGGYNAVEVETDEE